MTVPEPTRSMVETRALRMIAAGDDIKIVSKTTGLSIDELAKLRRDFPSTRPPVGAVKRCDQAACGRDATASAGGWSFCEQHAKAHTAPVEAPEPPAAAASPIGRLLEDASGHSVARVRTLAARIEGQLGQLRALISDHAEQEQTRRAAAAEREAAKARVKELEEQLRAARAALKGGDAKPTAAARPPATGEQVTGPQPCTSRGGDITRPRGSMGAWPKRCATCKGAAA